MSRHRVTRPTPVALLVAAIVAALLLVDVLSLVRLSEARSALYHTVAVSLALEKTLTGMTDAETANRGFLLTGDPGYLETFDRAQSELPAKLATLRVLTSGSASQGRRIDDLERRWAGRSAALNATVDLARHGHVDEAIETVRGGAGKQLMDEVRERASAMSAQEDDDERSRIAAMEISSHVSMAVLAAAGIVLFGLATILLSLDRDIRQRQALQRSLEEAVHAREQTLAIVSHDLRNPLSVVMMGAMQIERFASGDKPQERFKRHANTIIRAVDRMNRLVNDLLDMSKVEAGLTLPLDLARRNGAELLKQSVEQLEPLARGKRLSLAMLHPPPGAYDLDCDADRLQQVFSNLIGNAIKFTPEEGSITAGVARADGDIVFSVRDTGTGIPRAQIDRVFDPYWQVSASQSGAGLGLSIVKAIVHAHRGRVWVESEMGRGSSFHCALPAARPIEASRALPSEGRETTPSKPGKAFAVEGPNDRRGR